MNKYKKMLNYLNRVSPPTQNDYDLIKELVERATPKKILYRQMGTKQCKICGSFKISYGYNFCPNCGQALDRSDE